MSIPRSAIRILGTAVVSLSMLALAAPSASSQELDGRWLAFLGCWEPLEGDTGQDFLCFRPAEGGVEMFTVVAGELASTETIVADGSARPTSFEGCEGTEAAEFSDDGRRLFTHSDFVCADELPRTGNGVMSLIAPTQWLDVRSVDVEGERVAWVQRYRLVSSERVEAAGIADPTRDLDMSVRAARISAARELRLEDVEEAAAKVDAKAVEAWVAARGEQIDIDADAIVRLADAGIDESIIDVLVAVSHPDVFTIDPDGGATEAPRGGMRGSRVGDRYGYGPASSCYRDPYYFGWYTAYRSSFCRPYRYGYGYGFDYVPFGYYGGYGIGYRGYYPTTIIVERREPASTGRVIAGRGYRRIGGDDSGRGASPGGYTAGPSRSSGGSVGSSSAGSSSGGSSSTGRTAKPRGGR